MWLHRIMMANPWAGDRVRAPRALCKQAFFGHHGVVEHAEIAESVRQWAVGALPERWMESAPEVLVDNDEILLVVAVSCPDQEPAALREAITEFREATRAERIVLAAEAEERFGRKVAWGARAGGVTEMFTMATVPVMTRLRFSERATLDTLIDAGLARSRSEALAWCVRLVGANEHEWMAELRQAFEAVAEVRQRGPRSTRSEPPARPL